MALGGDIRFAVSHLVENWDKKALIRLPVSSLAKLTKEVLSYSADELVRRYHLAYPGRREPWPGPADLHSAGKGLSPEAHAGVDRHAA